MNENNLISLFTGYCRSGDTSAIILLSSRTDQTGAAIPVGVIYTNIAVPEDFIFVTPESGDEKYLLYYKGIGMYFSNWRKISK